MVDKTEYSAPSETPAVIAAIKEEGGAWEAELGGTLAKMISKNDYGPYTDHLALLEAIKSTRGAGKNAQAVGKQREDSVAEATGASVAATGKYGQDETVHLHGSDRHIKLDVNGNGIYGIVGGPAKAANLEKFRGICRDLAAISAQDQKTPQVFCSHDTPLEVVHAAMDIVGPENVIDIKTKKAWVLEPEMTEEVAPEMTEEEYEAMWDEHDRREMMADF